MYPYGFAQGIPCLGFQIRANDNGVPGIGTESAYRMDKNFAALAKINRIANPGDRYGYPGRTSKDTNFGAIIGPDGIVNNVFVKK